MKNPREWTITTLRERLTGGRGYLSPYNAAAGPLIEGDWVDLPGHGNPYQMCGAVKVVEKDTYDTLKAECDRYRLLLAEIEDGKYQYFESVNARGEVVPSYYEVIRAALFPDPPDADDR